MESSLFLIIQPISNKERLLLCFGDIRTGDECSLAQEDETGMLHILGVYFNSIANVAV